METLACSEGATGAASRSINDVKMEMTVHHTWKYEALIIKRELLCDLPCVQTEQTVILLGRRLHLKAHIMWSWGKYNKYPAAHAMETGYYIKRSVCWLREPLRCAVSCAPQRHKSSFVESPKAKKWMQQGQKAESLVGDAAAARGNKPR